MGYRLLYNITPTYKMILRIILLVVGVITDFAALFFIFNSIVISPNYWYAVAGVAVLGVMCRVIAIQLYQRIEYQMYGDRLVITKLYVIYSRVVVDCSLSEVRVISPIDGVAECNNAVDISDLSGEKYYLEIVSGARYICNLDDYMYALILEGKGK